MERKGFAPILAIIVAAILVIGGAFTYAKIHSYQVAHQWEGSDLSNDQIPRPKPPALPASVSNIATSAVAIASSSKATCTVNPPSQDIIHSEVQKYNHCGQASDCTVVRGNICGFLSGLITNKDEVDNVMPLITDCSSAPPRCIEDTFGMELEAACVDHQCRFVRAGSPPKDESSTEARDHQRLQDISNIKASVSLYLADAVNVHLGCADAKTIYASTPITPPAGWKAGANMGKTNIDGTGWIPIDFTQISAGAPFGALPVDPTNDPAQRLVYVFACDAAKQIFTLGMWPESAMYGAGGSKDVLSRDGGVNADMYEVGNIPTLLSDFQIKNPSESRDSHRLTDLHQIQNGLELYFQKCGYYPGITTSSCGAFAPISGFAQLKTVLPKAGVNIGKIPDDPLPEKHYFYAATDGGKSYMIGATLENSDNAVFKTYIPLSVLDYSHGDAVNCNSPNYCISL